MSFFFYNFIIARDSLDLSRVTLDVIWISATMSLALVHELEQLVSKYKDDPDNAMSSFSQSKVVVRYLISYLNPIEFKEWRSLFVFPHGTSIEVALNHAINQFPKSLGSPISLSP